MPPIRGWAIPWPRRTAANLFFLGLMRRAANWLVDEQARDQRSITVTHSTIIQAAVVHAMDTPPQSFWRMDIRPLSVTHLSSRGGRWNIISLGCTL